MDDFEVEFDRPCHKCGNQETRWRHCLQIGCDDGSIDLSDEDPINYMPGEEFELCYECYGTGVEWWCPKCGADLNAPHNKAVEPTARKKPVCVCGQYPPGEPCPVHD